MKAKTPAYRCPACNHWGGHSATCPRKTKPATTTAKRLRELEEAACLGEQWTTELIGYLWHRDRRRFDYCAGDLKKIRRILASTSKPAP